MKDLFLHVYYYTHSTAAIDNVSIYCLCIQIYTVVKEVVSVGTHCQYECILAEGVNVFAATFDHAGSAYKYIRIYVGN